MHNKKTNESILTPFNLLFFSLRNKNALKVNIM